MKCLRFVRFFAFTATAAFTGTVSAQESVPNLSPNIAPSTLAYWKLADGAGSIAVDTGPRHYNGTLVAFNSTDPDQGLLAGTSGWSSEMRLDLTAAAMKFRRPCH
jgi:hypothetical protein